MSPALEPPRFDAVEAMDFLDDPLWYKDAVIYQVHVKAFFDANDDGIGDFEGLIQKLDYIVSLGVNTIWILPFYPSPRRDDGVGAVSPCGETQLKALSLWLALGCSD